MDEGDISAEREEIERQSARLTCKNAEGPAPTGFCLYCDEILNGTRRWCEVEHREQWQKEARRGR